MTQPEQSDSAVYRYEAWRANGTEERGVFSWPRQTSHPREAERRVEFVVKDLLRRRFNRAHVYLDSREVGGIGQERPHGRRSPWWEEGSSS